MLRSFASSAISVRYCLSRVSYRSTNHGCNTNTEKANNKDISAYVTYYIQSEMFAQTSSGKQDTTHASEPGSIVQKWRGQSLTEAWNSVKCRITYCLNEALSADALFQTFANLLSLAYSSILSLFATRIFTMRMYCCVLKMDHSVNSNEILNKRRSMAEKMCSSTIISRWSDTASSHKK